VQKESTINEETLREVYRCAWRSRKAIWT